MQDRARGVGAKELALLAASRQDPTLSELVKQCEEKEGQKLTNAYRLTPYLKRVADALPKGWTLLHERKGRGTLFRATLPEEDRAVRGGSPAMSPEAHAKLREVMARRGQGDQGGAP